jgi:hypothetical protein
MRTHKVDKLHGLLREWVRRPDNEQFMYRSRVQQVEAGLADRSKAALVFMSMGLVAAWHAANGEVRVLDGDVGGWDQLRLGVGYQRLSLLGRYRSFETLTAPGKRFHVTPFMLANAVVMGLATGDPGGEPLQQIFTGRMPADFLAASFLTYPRFVRQLLAIRAGGKPAPDEAGGVHAPILASWSDPARLAKPLAAALDWHTERIEEKSRGDNAEFGWPEVMAFPAEILACLRIRETLGLANPEVDHPFLANALGVRPPARPWPDDPLSRRCEAYLRTL